MKLTITNQATFAFRKLSGWKLRTPEDARAAIEEILLKSKRVEYHGENARLQKKKRQFMKYENLIFVLVVKSRAVVDVFWSDKPEWSEA